MSWDDYWDERIRRVKENAPMDEILKRNNVPMRKKGGEEQFPCPLHGDGRDRNFSARYYPDTNSTYCWACKQARDPISWYRDYQRRKEGIDLEFSEALRELEQEFGIKPPPPPQDRGPGRSEDDPVPKEFRELCRIVDGEDPGPTDSDPVMRSFKRLDGIVRSISSEFRDSPQIMLPVLKLCYLADNLRHDYEKGGVGAEKASAVIEGIESKLKAAARKHGEAGNTGE